MSRLAESREARGLSRQELAHKANCTSEAIRLLEADKRAPTLQTAYAIAAALGLTVEEIWPPVSVPVKTG